MPEIFPIANVISHIKMRFFFCLVIKENVEDQRECRLSVKSSYKDVHHRCARRFNLIPLITMPTFSPSATPHLSDIHLYPFDKFEGMRKNFFLMIIRTEFKAVFFWILDILKLFHLCIFKAK